MSGKLFDQSNFVDELYHSMEKKLVAKQVEDTHGLKKIAKAVDYLYAAASIFDQAGLTNEAEEITEVLNGLVGKND